MGNWNFANVWEAIATEQPDAPALVHADRRVSWRTFEARAEAVARRLAADGLGHQDKVALYLTNGPEYTESLFACFKAALVPVNTNYRYVESELAYLWDNADVRAVVFHGSFTERADAVRPELPGITTWLWVDDGSGPCPPWATPYEDAATASDAPPYDLDRSGDDILMVYTGGTTGMPKGVMWRQDDLFSMLTTTRTRDFGTDGDPAAVVAHLRTVERRPVCLPAAPLMHGTGTFIALLQLSEGGCVVTLPSPRFDAATVLDAVARERVTVLGIVGDAFARPLVDALDAEPERWDLSSLRLVVSSGAMWSDRTKGALVEHIPGVRLLDQLASSEALGIGASVTKKDRPTEAASFRISDRVRVVDEEFRFIEPGSEQIGRVAIRGRGPVGYYKDPEKSAATFPVIDGVRWAVPGDYATVAADGSLKFLGRGSVSINTGGEKVFPEEVEEVVKAQPGIVDAVVVGVPHERFGEMVVAVVEPALGTEPDAAAITAAAKETLAPYKVPRHIVPIDTIGRGPNGKVDYRRLKQYATDRLSPPAAP